MSTKSWAALGLAAVLATGLAGCSDDDNDPINLPIPGNAQAYLLERSGNVHAITRLVNSGNGNGAAPTQTIGGLPTGEEIVGMDFRPRDGKLYLLGRNGAAVNSLGAVYVINDLAASGSLTATLVSELQADPNDMSSPFTGLADGVSYGVDFNPQANALRIVGSNGSNLRIPFGGAGAVPVQLVVVTDTNLTQGGNAKSGIVAAGYTNNVDLATSTSLLVMSGSELFTQAPPNDGVLTAVGGLNIGGTAYSAASTLSFDILSASSIDTGFFLAQTSGASDDVIFGTVNLSSGALTILAEGDAGSSSFVGLAMKAAAP